MSSGTPHFEGGGLYLITVGLDPEVAEIAKQAAVQESFQFLNAFPDYAQTMMHTLPQQLEGAEALLCLIDFDKNQELAVQTATIVQPFVKGRTALIALSGDEKPELILHAMRAGCSEYLTKPLQGEQLSSCLRKLRARWVSSSIPPNQAGGRVLAFLSVRGGAGATTVTVHLGTFLAKRHAQKTLIVDLHPHLGHVAMLLGIDTRSYGFDELLRNVSRLDLTLLRSYVIHHSSGVDVLLSPESLCEANPVCVDMLPQAIRFLADAYNHVLIDCTSGWEELNRTAIGCCNELFLVATPEVPALRDLSRYVDHLLESYVPPEKLKVVINQHDSRRTVTIEQIEKAIQHPVAFTLPTSSAEMIRAVDTGEPISPEKRSEFANQIKSWASTLVPEKVVQTEIKRRFAFWN